jgi:vitamin B12 transporter
LIGYAFARPMESNAMRTCALIFLMVPVMVRAQSLPSDATITVTATRVPTKVDQVAGGVTIIDRATIEQRGYVDLVQALSAVPGLRVVQSGGPGAQTSVFIRGTNSNQVLVLRDGVPINDPGDPGGAFNFGVDTLNDVDRIEVVRGPLSSVYGSGALGGVINLISRGPRDGLHGSVTLAGGSQTTGLAQGNLAGKSGIWDFAASAEGFSTRGFDQTPPRESVHTGEADGDRGKVASLSVGVTPVAGTRVSLDLRARDQKYGYDEQGFVTYDGGNASGYDATVSGRAQVVSNLLDGAWTTNLSVARVQDDRRYTVTFDPRDPNDDTEDSHYHGRRTDAEWNNTVRLPEYGVATQTALTFGYQHVNDTADTHINSSSGGFPYLSSVHAHEDSDAGYLGGSTLLWKALTVTGQIREDATTDAGDAFTWRLGGVLATPVDGVRLKASYGTGFRAPALFDRYGVDNFGFHGNPDLRPERSEGWDAGVEADLPVPAAYGASVSVMYFSNRIRDLIQEEFSPVDTSVNIASARAQGVEAGLTLRAATWLSGTLSYTYTDARDLSTGGPLLRRPHNQGAANVTITPWPGMQLVPELVYTGAFSDFLVNNLGEGTSTGLTRSGLIANLSVSWQATQAIRLFAWGKNLGDSRFEPVSGYVTPGRSVLAGVKYSF